MRLPDPAQLRLEENPGATTCLRTGSKRAQSYTLVGDAAKGWFAVWLALPVCDGGAPYAAPPVFPRPSPPGVSRFRGGKGVANERRACSFRHRTGRRSRHACDMADLAFFVRYSSSPRWSPRHSRRSPALIVGMNAYSWPLL